MTDETMGDEWPPGIADELPTRRPQHYGSAPTPESVVGGYDESSGGGVTNLGGPVHLPGAAASPVDYAVVNGRYSSSETSPGPVADPDLLADDSDCGRPPRSSTTVNPSEPSTHARNGDPGIGDLVLEEMTAGFQRLDNRIEALREDRSTLELMVIGLQSRNEELQGDLVMRALAPIVKELAMLQGQARKMATEAVDRFEASVAADVAFDFQDFGERIGEAADALGIEAMGVKVGDPFDRKRHQAAGRVSTTIASLDKCVAAVIHEGYWTSGIEKPVVYAKVRVYQHEELEPTDSDPTVAEQPERDVAIGDMEIERTTPVAKGPRTQQDDEENEQ